MGEFATLTGQQLSAGRRQAATNRGGYSGILQDKAAHFFQPRAALFPTEDNSVLASTGLVWLIYGMASPKAGYTVALPPLLVAPVTSAVQVLRGKPRTGRRGQMGEEGNANKKIKKPTTFLLLFITSQVALAAVLSRQ